MTSSRPVVRSLAAASGVLVALAALAVGPWWGPADGSAPAAHVRGGERAASARQGVAAGLSAALRQVRSCEGGPRRVAPGVGCPGVVYVGSELMPLSRPGVAQVARAAAALGLPLAVVDAAELEGTRPVANVADGARPVDAPPISSPEDSLRTALVAAGATLHHPAVVVHGEGRLVGPAFLGYKTAAAWERLLAERLASRREPGSAGPSGGLAPPPGSAPDARTDAVTWRDLPVEGRPGPYFKWVPGRGSLAYEDRRVIHLLDVGSGRTDEGPGWIDFIPSPDGRLFVMPGPARRGLHVYDADEVYRAVRTGRGREVDPFFVDPALRDQYPSVGLLGAGPSDGVGAGTGVDAAGDPAAAVYRVLTSWYDGVVFRDYAVGPPRRARPPELRPRGPRVPACPGVRLSIPILSRDGREVAGRDEATGTTKVFALDDDGSCREVLDLGIPTGKVAFGPAGRRIAFAVPDGVLRDGSGAVPGRGAAGEDLSGVFVLDREAGDVRRVEGSRNVDRLAFPDFLGPDSVVFLVAGDGRRGSRFRVAPLPPDVD